MIPIRKTLTEILDKESTNDTIYILLSAGIDSQSVLFSCLELGKKVVVVSFTREDHESRDFICAREIAKQLQLEFIHVSLPTDVKNMSQTLLDLANNYDCKLKTDFECMYPMIYAYKAIEKHAIENNIKDINITSGLGADTYYLLSKKASIHYKNRPDVYRDLLYFNPNYSQRCKHEKLCKDKGFNHVMPYFRDDVYNLFKGKSKAEVNTPKEKNDVREQYKDELIEDLLFKHTSFQKGDSLISDMFSILLETEWNVNNWRSVTGIYNALAAKRITQPINDDLRYKHSTHISKVKNFIIKKK